MILSRGIDVRPKLVEEVNTIARSLGESFDGLVFETGTIESFLLESTSKHQSTTTAPRANDTSSQPEEEEAETMEVLIALHACDTATDDALWAGICRNAAVICVAPCCHKEIRPQIDKHYQTSTTTMNRNQDDIFLHHPLQDVLRYGIYRERMTETITDAMRALMLEMMGYDVNVFEFIGGEHTSKNVMITAVKQPRNLLTNRATGQQRTRLQALAQFHGVSRQKLAFFMREDLRSDKEMQTKSPESLLLPGRMPPL